MMGTDHGEGQHPIFTKDPEEWAHYLHKDVYVGTVDGAWHHGWVYTIDPVSESLVLVNEGKVEVIMGHAVQSMAVTGQVTEQYKQKADQLFRFAPMEHIPPEQLQARCEQVKEWLLTNRLPVEEKGDVIRVCSALDIRPPYTAQSCYSTNEIILGRIQGLLEAMPANKS
jgi:gem associated protein 6